MRSGRRRLVYAALLAIGLHLDLALIFVLLLHGGTSGPEVDPSFEDTISLEAVDPEVAQQLLAELDKAEEEALRKEKESPQAPGQVVELPRPAEPSERPDRARFVAEHDSKVERETKRTALAQEQQRPAAPTLLAMRAPAPAPPARSAGGPSAPPTPPGLPEPGASPGPSFDPDGALSTPPALGARAPQPALPDQSRAGKDAPADQRKQPGPIALLPNSMQLARAIGGGTPDHLVDVDEGPTTALNAKQWKFASFFNRVKRQVAQHWRPAQQYEKRDPTGNIYGSGQWVTLLRIMLKPDGSLSSVDVAKPSGLEFLDDEAVEAIKRGQPYPNPPPQLISEGVVGFRFGFFFDVDGGPRVKVYRYSGL